MKISSDFVSFNSLGGLLEAADKESEDFINLAVLNVTDFVSFIYNLKTSTGIFELPTDCFLGDR